ADEWEVLAEKLEAGENYASKNGDHRFEEPLLLDFFLDDPAVSNEKATL
ncbi:unnamed protein product, partial [Ascophyllum nodosum]